MKGGQFLQARNYTLPSLPNFFVKSSSLVYNVYGTVIKNLTKEKGNKAGGRQKEGRAWRR